MNRTFRIITTAVALAVFFCSAGLNGLRAQSTSPYGVEVPPVAAEGLPIRNVVILLVEEKTTRQADSLELAAFYNAFGLLPGAGFKQQVADLALNTIRKQPEVKAAEYHVYNHEPGGPVVLVVQAVMLRPGELKEVEGRKGMAVSGGMQSFPTIIETDRSKVTFILNGAVGLFNEVNALFAQGPAFTEGNAIADDPATEGVRFWGEAFIEPGIGGITRLGNTKIYPYGAMSFLVSGRNSSDIYSEGPTVFGAFERLYGGVLLPRLGRRHHINIDLSAGRNFFQLNDAFLFSRISGSANAGERGSVYLSSRTAYQMTALAKVQVGRFTADGFFLEPQELFKDRQANTRYLGGGLTYNNNDNLDIGCTYISIPSSLAQNTAPTGRIPVEGIYVINPKVWISDILGTGLFVKTEYAWQSHATADMRAHAWYAGVGIRKSEWRMRPSLYYRFAFMQGDDPATPTYERFDALQTGGLGNWVQGINFRKISGDGNLVTHRVELKVSPRRNWDISLDYFMLMADQLNNLGGLAPISTLQDKELGHEVTMTLYHSIGRRYLFLGIFSWSRPGEGIELPFEDQARDWTSLQGALFMFF